MICAVCRLDLSQMRTKKGFKAPEIRVIVKNIYSTEQSIRLTVKKLLLREQGRANVKKQLFREQV